MTSIDTDIVIRSIIRKEKGFRHRSMDLPVFWIIAGCSAMRGSFQHLLHQSKG